MDIHLHYIEQGSGTPFVLLHGNGEDHRYFSHQIDYFSAPSRGYRVIAPDTRGHGSSPRGSAPFTFAQFADDLVALLRELGITRTHLLGFSDGASTAMHVALRYPQMIDRLILCGANLNPRGVKLSVQLPVCLGYGLVSFISCFDHRAQTKREILGLMVHQPHISPESLSSLTMPTLVIAGTRDMIRDAHTDAIAAAIPNAVCIRLKGSHFIAAEAPDRFNTTLERFLRGENMQNQTII